jgi:phage terminase large subunit-like protein
MARTRRISTDTPAGLAIGYARDVDAGRVPAGPYVKLACNRFLRDLGRKDWPYTFDAETANNYVKFIQTLPHVKGKWAAHGETLRLGAWQCFIECNLFGWLSEKTGLRRFRQSYEEIPRKNGKSTRVGSRGIFMLTGDREAGAEIYAGATTEKQAHEVFRPAWQMIKKSEKLRSVFHLEMAGNSNNPGPIYRIRDMSRFETMIGKPGDGASPHAALIDEFHEHDSPQMLETMLTGMGAREQPLLSIITTAGSNLGGPCYEKRRDVIRILEQQDEDETLFGIIYGLDPDDQWDDPANLVKANPNYDVSVFGEFLNAMLAQARRSSTRQNAFRTKHLNEWMGAKTAWMNMLAWQRQKRTLQVSDFKGCRCWLGVDLASKIDITALVMLFEKNEQYYCIPRFYVPEKAVEENEKYREYVTGGELTATPGTMTDYEFLEEEIKSVAKQVQLQDIAFDPTQASYVMTRLTQSRLPVIEFAQNVRNLSEPMKECEALILAGNLFHDGNLAMTWMMGNVMARLDAKGHIYPRKENDYDPKCKIDGVVALIMAMGRALLTKQAPNYKIFFIGK